MRVLLALVVALLSACSQAPAGPLVLSPAPELAEATEAAAARWSAATGLDVVVGAGGVPVAYGSLDARPWSCATTLVSDGRVKAITLRHPGADMCHGDVEVRVLHELGHALCLGGADGCHTDDGLMSEWGSQPNQVLDEAALSAVCAFADCSAFVPEAVSL